MLTNPKSNRIKHAAKLFKKRDRKKRQEFLVEGPQAVRELLKHAPERVLEIFVTPETLQKYPEFHAALELSIDKVAPANNFHEQAGRSNKVEFTLVSEEVIAALSETVTPQGIVAVAKILQQQTVMEASLFQGAQLVAVMNEVRDPGNAGAVLRAADAAGADAVIFVGDSIDPWHPKVVRSTTGSLFHLKVYEHDSPANVIAALKQAGLKTIAADVRGTDLELTNEVLQGPAAWVFGNEAHGLAEAEREMCDEVLKLPIFGKAESLNLATAAAVCLYSSAFKQRT